MIAGDIAEKLDNEFQFVDEVKASGYLHYYASFMVEEGEGVDMCDITAHKDGVVNELSDILNEIGKPLTFLPLVIAGPSAGVRQSMDISNGIAVRHTIQYMPFGILKGYEDSDDHEEVWSNPGTLHTFDLAVEFQGT